MSVMKGADAVRKAYEEWHTPIEQKRAQEIVAIMIEKKLLTYQSSALSALCIKFLEEDGFEVTSHTTKPTSECTCDYTACNNHPRTITTVKVKEPTICRLAPSQL